MLRLGCIVSLAETGEGMQTYLSKDDPFNKSKVGEKITELLKEFYPGMVVVHGVKIYARNMEHYAAGETLYPFLQKLWVCLDCNIVLCSNFDRYLLTRLFFLFCSHYSLVIHRIRK